MKYKDRLEYAIRRIKRLDAKEEQLTIQAEYIRQTSAIGQSPPILETTWNKILSLMAKKAQIWNEDIRNKIMPNTQETFWQAGIRAGLELKNFGQEEILLFGAKEIRNLSILCWRSSHDGQI